MLGLTVLYKRMQEKQKLIISEKKHKIFQSILLTFEALDQQEKHLNIKMKY